VSRYAGTTKQRGYGASHQALRKQLLARWRPGDPCARCGQPMMYRWLATPDGRRVSAIDLGHTDDRRSYTGLEHRSCNRRDGQRKTTAVLRRRGGLTARQLAAVRMRQWQASAMAKAGEARQARTW
jgi:hypothetical protein